MPLRPRPPKVRAAPTGPARRRVGRFVAAALLAAGAALAPGLPPVAAAQSGTAATGGPEDAAADAGGLVLWGEAVRDKLGIAVYRLSLYLPERGLGAGAVASPDVAKVFRVEILYGGDLPEEVPDDWRAELVPATSDGQMAALRDAYADLSEGDVIRIAYAPGAGSTVAVNGRPVVEADGHAIAGAAGALWLGDDPAAPAVRDALLAR